MVHDGKHALDALRHTVHRASTYLAKLQLAGRSVTIAPLEPIDASRVHEAFKDDGAAPVPADLLDQKAGNTTILAAWCDNRPLGFGFMHWPGPRDLTVARRWPATPEIFRLCVAPRYRSLGVGSMIIHRFEEMAADRGMTRVGLGVHEQNTLARDLYVRLGYVLDSVRFHDEYDVAHADGTLQHVKTASVFLVKPVGFKVA